MPALRSAYHEEMPDVQTSERPAGGPTAIAMAPASVEGLVKQVQDAAALPNNRQVTDRMLAIVQERAAAVGATLRTDALAWQSREGGTLLDTAFALCRELEIEHDDPDDAADPDDDDVPAFHVSPSLLQRIIGHGLQEEEMLRIGTYQAFIHDMCALGLFEEGREAWVDEESGECGSRAVYLLRKDVQKAVDALSFRFDFLALDA